MEAGRHAISVESPPSPSDDHFDIISAIFEIKKRLPVRLIYRHVEGHQREKYPGRPLDSWALLNDDVDTLAKAYCYCATFRTLQYGSRSDMTSGLSGLATKKNCKNFKHAIREKLEQRRLTRRAVVIHQKAGKGPNSIYQLYGGKASLEKRLA